ncbi:MAG TPA: hypothetical protein VHK46_05780 [Gaiellaceae bacterium]|jgi:hypothetical protein|nr:hypothetical protein [Gaiellaceae bacterium]
MKGFSNTMLVACACAALVVAAPAAADVSVGVADDRGKMAGDGGVQFLADMRDVGLTENRITLAWDPEHPTTIRNKERLDVYLANAAAAGIRISIVIAPSRARALFGSTSAANLYVAFVAQVARTYRQVKDIAVGNEPNQPRFWQPQFSTSGVGLACNSYARVLARAYDALKAVDRTINVVGVSLSPRGNDNALAATNASTSPVRCIRDMGVAYRASGRKRPIMDELAFHPHPNSNTDTFLVGYRWPNAGTSNLGRIKQAIWDAFRGTAQPVFAEAGRPVSRAGLPPLRFRLNEIGWQTVIPASSSHAYYGRESVPRLAEDRHQSDVYSALIPYYACDESVRSMLYYGLVDEPDLDRWQAGLIRADGTRRPSYNSVKQMLARGLARCTKRPVRWRHSTVVVGATARFGERRRSAGDTNWTFTAGSEEASTFRAAMYRVKGRGLSAAGRKRLLAAVGAKRSPKPVLSVRGKARAHQGTFVRFKRKRLKPGRYVFAIRLRAEMNPTRTTSLVSRPFAVGLR